MESTTGGGGPLAALPEEAAKLLHDLGTLNINGPGPAYLTVSGNRECRVFRIVFGTVTISGLTITRGLAVVGISSNDALAHPEDGPAAIAYAVRERRIAKNPGAAAADLWKRLP